MCLHYPVTAQKNLNLDDGSLTTKQSTRERLLRSGSQQPFAIIHYDGERFVETKNSRKLARKKMAIQACHRES